jgi:quercetin dioxygenase-like cupin family protein
MFGTYSPNGYHEILAGIKIKTINFGASMLMTEFLLQKDSILPEHSHLNEQSGYLVKGRIKLFINGIPKICKPGDSWCIAENVKHKAEIMEDSVAVEVFSPARDDYLKYKNDEDLIQ